LKEKFCEPGKYLRSQCKEFLSFSRLSVSLLAKRAGFLAAENCRLEDIGPRKWRVATGSQVPV